MKSIIGQAQTARADVRSTAISDMGSAEGAALQSGIVGSSVDAINRAGVLEARGQGLAQVAAAKGDALAQLRQTTDAAMAEPPRRPSNAA